MSGFSLVMSTCPSGGEGGKREYIYNISCRCVGILLLGYTEFCMGIFFILVFWVSFLQALIQTDQAGEGTGEEASDKIGPADDEAAGLSSASKGGTL